MFVTFGRYPHRSAAPRVLLLVLLVVLAACTGSDDEADQSGDATEQADESDGAAPGAASEAAPEVVAAAETWLRDVYDLGQAMLSDLELTGVTTSPGVSHVTFDQAIDGITVRGAQITVHVLDSGEVQTATDDLVDASAEPTDPSVEQAAATDIAAKAVTGQVDGDPAAMLVWLRNGPDLALAWEIEVATVQPTSSWTVLVDAGSGAVLSVKEAGFGRHVDRPTAPGAALGLQRQRIVAQGQGGDACDVPAPGACVFLPDPIYAAGGSLEDRSTANEFLTGVELQGLDDPTALVGEYVNAEPSGAPVEPTRESDSTWATGRAGRGFEAAMAYYWIDRVQRQIQRLGFSDVLASPFAVVPVDPDVVDNAFYSPAEVRIHLGVGSDGVNEGEDASGIVHEYGHAVLDAMVPGLLDGAEAGAYHESFGDLLAFLTTLPERTGDAGCLFAWTEENECLRRVDSDKVYPQDLQREVHADGEIYNGAIYDVTSALLAAEGVDIAECPGTADCDEVLDRVLTTLLASHGYLPNGPSLPDVAEAFVLANDAAFGGADADAISTAFAEHGLIGGGESMVDSSGQPMVETGGVSVVVDISHTYRGDLDLVVGVVDASYTDLCEPIQLFTPDEADDEDDLVGEVDLTGEECAGLIPPSPEQIWYLQAVDTLAQDEGQINAFEVHIDGVPYLAPGLPTPIGDADPAGAFALVDGSGEIVPPEGSQDMTDVVSSDVPVLSLAISHSYVGDLDISAGVVDEDANIICSVQIHQPDPSDSSGEGIAGEVDMSGCAEFYPPAPSQRWYLLAIDTAAADEGAIDQFSLSGPDEVVHEATEVPAAIPDADVDGVALLLDGSGSSSGQAGGGGASSDLPAITVAATHPYRGDLAITAGVLSADGDVLCEVVVASPDVNISEADLLVEASMADCSRYYPPTPQQNWYVFAADTLEADTGSVDGVILQGPDGVNHAPAGTPIDLPDADPSGVVLLIDGSISGSDAGGDIAPPEGGGDVTARYSISHTYIGDLTVNVGVADAAGTVLCEQPVRVADPQDAGQGLQEEVSLGECGAAYPPSPDTVFYLEVIDTAEIDTGTIEAFTIIGPDGTSHDAAGLPAAIPDADEAGVVVAVDR